MKRGLLRQVARCLAAVLFLTQLMVAAYACPGMSPAMAAHAQTGQTEQGMAASPPQGGEAATAAPMANCSDMAGAMDPDAANLCAEHCKYGQQSDHAPTLTVPAAILSALYATPVVPPAPLPRSAAVLTGAPVAASLPHAILHCVFRI
jgi:hypothetical protein